MYKQIVTDPVFYMFRGTVSK